MTGIMALGYTKYTQGITYLLGSPRFSQVLQLGHMKISLKVDKVECSSHVQKKATPSSQTAPIPTIYWHIVYKAFSLHLFMNVLRWTKIIYQS